MASPVDPWPDSLGINMPLSTSVAGGFTYLISPKKHAAITNTSTAINSSSFLTWTQSNFFLRKKISEESRNAI
jgi:hypothetical protein